jgi:uncharacterized NAD-dependent epimerase/dehydratase family protein
MPAQNLVSASLPAATKDEIIASLATIKAKLGFLLTLQSKEVHSLFKAGRGYAPFIDKAYNAAREHTKILPAVFDREEFERDYKLTKDLELISLQIDELAEGVHNTLTAVLSDALAASLEVYASVRQHRDKVPGLNVVADEMGVFFKKTRKKAAPKLV